MLARGNNTSFLLLLEKRRLKYIGGLAKNRQGIITQSEKTQEKIRLNNLAQSLPAQAFTPIQLNVENKKLCGWQQLKLNYHNLKEREQLLSS